MTLKIFDQHNNTVYQTNNAWNAESELDWSDFNGRYIGINGKKYQLMSVRIDDKENVAYEVEEVQ